MTELEMTTEAEVEDFTDELSDEALDRAEGAFCLGSIGRRGPSPWLLAVADRSSDSSGS